MSFEGKKRIDRHRAEWLLWVRKRWKNKDTVWRIPDSSLLELFEQAYAMGEQAGEAREINEAVRRAREQDEDR